MAFRFLKANSVAVGAFNIYIVQPHWLTRKGVIPAGEVTLEAKLDEPGFRLCSLLQQRVQWAITPTRIIIETDDPEANCGETLARLLDFLPETPITAVGNNTHYTESLEEDIAHPGFPHDFPVLTTLAGDTLQQRTFHVGVKRGQCLYNVQSALTAGRAELLVNAHCQISEQTGEVTPQSHLRLFKEHRTVGIELAKHHLKVTVDV